jgi:hypothetical protein
MFFFSCLEKAVWHVCFAYIFFSDIFVYAYDFFSLIMVLGTCQQFWYTVFLLTFSSKYFWIFISMSSLTFGLFRVLFYVSLNSGLYCDTPTLAYYVLWFHSPFYYFFNTSFFLHKFNVFHYSVFINVYKVPCSCSPHHPLLSPSSLFWSPSHKSPLLDSCPFVFCWFLRSRVHMWLKIRSFWAVLIFALHGDL